MCKMVVYLCIHMYHCSMHVYMYNGMCAHIDICIYYNPYMCHCHMYVYTCVCVYVYNCMMYLYIYICSCVYIHVFKHMCVHACIL